MIAGAACFTLCTVLTEAKATAALTAITMCGVGEGIQSGQWNITISSRAGVNNTAVTALTKNRQATCLDVLTDSSNANITDRNPPSIAPIVHAADKDKPVHIPIPECASGEDARIPAFITIKHAAKYMTTVADEVSMMGICVCSVCFAVMAVCFT